MRSILLVSVMLVACGRTDPNCIDPDCPTPVDFVSDALRMRGLWTNPDDLNAPEGSCAQADNVVLDRPGIMEPRPGFPPLASGVSGAINTMKWWLYGGTWYLVVHHGTTSLSRWNGSSWTAYSGSYSAPDSNTKVAMEVAEDSLFFTTAAGVYELDSPTGTPRLAGVPGALDSTATLRRTANEVGWAGPNKQWAYRSVFALVNANRRLELGATSGRFIVQNPANVTALAANISKAGSAVVTVVSTTHGFTTGEYVDVVITGDANFTSGRFSVTRVSDTAFTYNDGGGSPTATSTVNATYGFTARDIDLSIRIPSGITTSHVVQIHRSAASATATTEPNDYLKQVYERSPTNLEITAGVMTIKDIVPDEMRNGPDLYTSINGEIAQKAVPPQCNALAFWRGSMWYACTQQVHTLEFTLQAVGGTGGLVQNDVLYLRSPTLSVAEDSHIIALDAQTSENLPNGQFKIYTDGTASQNVANTAKSMVRAINARTTNTTVYAVYDSGATDAPGRIRVFGRSPTVDRFTLQLENYSTGEPFFPQIPKYIEAGSVVRSANVVTVDTVGNHGLSAGQLVPMERITGAAEGNFALGTKTVATVVDPNTFTYNETGSNATAVSVYAFASQPLDVFASDNTDRTTGLMWSPPNEPWTVPLAHLKLIGNGTNLRVVADRGRLLVLTDNGAFEVTGQYPAWNLDGEYDTTLKLAAYNTAAVAGGRPTALTTQGVVEMLDSPRVISQPIDKALMDLLAQAGSTVRARAFGVGYDSGRKYLLFLPDASGESDADQVYLWHQASEDWTRWPINSMTAAAVHPGTDQLYIGMSDGTVKVENKGRVSAEDYYDNTVSVTVEASPAPTTTSCLLTSASGVSVGDTIRFSTGQEGLITAIATNTLTYTGPASVAAGAATVYTAYTATVEPVALMGDAPHQQKLFTRGTLFFKEALFTNGGLAFASDIAPTLSAVATVSPIGGATTSAKAIDFIVPTGKQRASRLRMVFTLTAARNKFALQGWHVEGRECGQGTNR